MRNVLLLLLLTTLSSATFAQTPRVQRIEITEFGIYEVKVTKDVDAPGTATGTLHIISDVKLVQATTTIPTRSGITFGYRYKIIGSPANTQVTLRDINIVPPPGLRNPATGNTLVREEAQVVKLLGATATSTYTLGSEWTLVPGIWTFELCEGDRKLAEQEFTLVKP